MKQSWKCPYCNQHATITVDSCIREKIDFTDRTKNQSRQLIVDVIQCPNSGCQEYSIESILYESKFNATFGEFEGIGDPVMKWQLKPLSQASSLPQYIPVPIREDYQESCTIRDLSPKASATLSRRCLQGMIRDFWGIKKNRLIDEIMALKKEIDLETWEAIDSVRKIGNIGAHMEKDINTIIDVDPGEAQALISLIEILIKEWYIARYEKAQRMQQIKNIAAKKEEAKKR